MKILVAGDFCDKYRVKTAISEENYSLMFDGIKDVVQQADISIVNFEFPIVEKDGKPIKKCGPNLSGQKKSIDAIKYAGFNVCTLANNHILDQGEECCLNTKQLIEDAGIRTVGVGNNLQEASRVLYIEHECKTIAIINCCENEFSIATDKTPGSYPLSPIRQYKQITEARKRADLVLVIVHGGHEHCDLPSPRMKETYHFMVDAGSDVVVNHHQHCYSGYEIYNGKPIIYGLGNLLFDNPAQRESKWNIGYLALIECNDVGSINVTQIPYKQCNSHPAVVKLTDEEEKIFLMDINRINTIINDDNLLYAEWSKWLEKDGDWVLPTLFEPWQSRISRLLYRHKILPTRLKGENLLLLQNVLLCESHFDRIKHLLRKKHI